MIRVFLFLGLFFSSCSVFAFSTWWQSSLYYCPDDNINDGWCNPLTEWGCTSALVTPSHPYDGTMCILKPTPVVCSSPLVRDSNVTSSTYNTCISLCSSTQHFDTTTNTCVSNNAVNCFNNITVIPPTLCPIGKTCSDGSYAVPPILCAPSFWDKWLPGVGNDWDNKPAVCPDGAVVAPPANCFDYYDHKYGVGNHNLSTVIASVGAGVATGAALGYGVAYLGEAGILAAIKGNVITTIMATTMAFSPITESYVATELVATEYSILAASEGLSAAEIAANPLTGRALVGAVDVAVSEGAVAQMVQAQAIANPSGVLASALTLGAVTYTLGSAATPESVVAATSPTSAEIANYSNEQVVSIMKKTPAVREYVKQHATELVQYSAPSRLSPSIPMYMDTIKTTDLSKFAPVPKVIDSSFQVPRIATLPDRTVQPTADLSKPVTGYPYPVPASPSIPVSTQSPYSLSKPYVTPTGTTPTGTTPPGGSVEICTPLNPCCEQTHTDLAKLNADLNSVKNQLSSDITAAKNQNHSDLSGIKSVLEQMRDKVTSQPACPVGMEPIYFSDPATYFEPLLNYSNPFTWSVSEWMPTLPASGCSYELHFSAFGHQVDLAPCQPLAPLREMLAWFFGISTFFGCFYILFKAEV